MKANKTKHLIYELVQIAFGNRERDNRRLHDMHQIVDVELAELERLAEIGRATQKAFDSFDILTVIKFLEKEHEEQEEQFVDTQKSRDFDVLEDLLEWAKGVE